MAANSSSKATQGATLGKTPVSIHEYYNWEVDRVHGDPDAIFAATVLDIAAGTRTIAGILANHLTDLESIADGNDDPTLLSKNDTEALARLAVFSLRQLHEMASCRVEHFNREAEKGARA